MKGNGRFVSNLLILIAGVVLIILHDRVGIIPGIIIVTGITFIVPSVINMAILLADVSKKPEERYRNKTSFIAGMIASVGGFAMGLWMVVYPDSLVGLLVYLFAGILLLGGIYHLYMLIFGLRPLRFPMWMYIFPSLLVIAGIAILSTDIKTIEAYVVLISGVAMVVFALNTFLEQIGARSFAKHRNELNE